MYGPQHPSFFTCYLPDYSHQQERSLETPSNHHHIIKQLSVVSQPRPRCLQHPASNSRSVRHPHLRIGLPTQARASSSHLLVKQLTGPAVATLGPVRRQRPYSVRWQQHPLRSSCGLACPVHPAPYQKNTLPLCAAHRHDLPLLLAWSSPIYHDSVSSDLSLH